MDSSALTSPKRWQLHTRRASGHPGDVSARQPAQAAAAETPLERPWRDCFITRFDLVVFIWLAPAIRLARLRRREAERDGPAVIAPGGPLHDKVESFLAWTARYDDGEVVERSRTRHEAWLARLSCPVVRLMTTAAVDEHVTAIARQLGAPHAQRRRQQVRGTAEPFLRYQLGQSAKLWALTALPPPAGSDSLHPRGWAEGPLCAYSGRRYQ
jgi:hypothetical protein